MTSTMSLTFPLALAALASCAMTPNDGCAGWKPVRLAGASIVYFAGHDPEALKTLIAHQEFGKAMRCW